MLIPDKSKKKKIAGSLDDWEKKGTKSHNQEKEETEPTLLHLPKNLKKRTKIFCLESEEYRSMSKVVTEALTEYLDKKEEK